MKNQKWKIHIGGAALVLTAAVLIGAGLHMGEKKTVIAAGTSVSPAAASASSDPSASSTAAPTGTPDPNLPISVMDAPVEERVTRKGMIYEYTGLYARLIGCTDAAKTRTVINIPGKIAVNDIYYDVTIIDCNALRGCTNLKQVTFGKNLKQIRYNAFQGDLKLKKITFKGTKVKQIGMNAFKDTADMPVFYMPASVKKQYTKLIKRGKPSNWSTYKKL